MKRSLLIFLSFIFVSFINFSQVDFTVVLVSDCSSENMALLYQASGCDIIIYDSNGTIAYETVIPEQGDLDYFNYEITFSSNPLFFPYTLEFDEECLNTNGIVLDEYTYEFSNFVNNQNVDWTHFNICPELEEIDEGDEFEFSVTLVSDCAIENMTLLYEASDCMLIIKDKNGETVFVTQIPEQGNSDYFYYEFDFMADPNLFPYTLEFDQLCLDSAGISLEEYTYEIPSFMNNQSIDWIHFNICPELEDAELQDYSFGYYGFDCYTGDETVLATLMESECTFWIENGNGDILTEEYFSFDQNYYQNIEFQASPSDAPFYLVFDEDCLTDQGIIVYNNQWTMDVTDLVVGGYSTDICFGFYEENDSETDTFTIVLVSDCYEHSNLLYEGEDCSIIIRDKNDNTSYITYLPEDYSLGYFYYVFTFEADSSLFPYSLEFDQDCLNGRGIFLNEYIYEVYNYNEIEGYVNHNFFNICPTLGDPVEDDCSDVWGTVSPWVGYYQNYVNSIRFEWGNYNNTTTQAEVVITMPPGVSPISSSFIYPFTINGSELILDMILNPYSTYVNVIRFDVPGGISDGMLHTYGISVLPMDEIPDCDYANNLDTLHQVVGNSYDPNAKTVNLPETIDPEVQDEFLYTIYFQNTGTAPAQDIYIIDTLSNNLDLSTFEFARSSHSVEIEDLGNGIMRFNFNQIWLPDSATNLALSNGFVSFHIKEKVDNPVGSEIFNTAYIYFDQNEAIITNTTYNINKSFLGLENHISTFQVELFPNPATETTNVVAHNLIEKIEILSADGKVCKQLYPNSLSCELDVSVLNSGIYFIKVFSGVDLSVVKLFKN